MAAAHHPSKQYTMFKDLEDLVQSRAIPDVSDRFDDRPRASAYYGAFLDQLGTVASDRSEDVLVAEAIWIDDTVNDAVRSLSINQNSIEAAIRKAMLPRYSEAPPVW